MRDSKLHILVKRIVLDDANGIIITNNTSCSLHVQKVFEILCSKFVEYRRKNQRQLRQAVEATLKKVIQTLQQERTVVPAIENKGQKRGRDSNVLSTSGGEEEDEPLSSDEEEARRLDQSRQEFRVTVGGGSMLNASLQNNYLQRQKEKETEDRKRDNERESKADTPSTPQRSNNDTATKSEEPNVAVSTPQASTKKKKKKLRRSESNVSMGDAESSSSNWLSVAERPKARYSDLGGMNNVLQEIRQLIEYPLTHPEIFVHLGVEPPRGVLFRGPPGTGKTLLAEAVAGELGVPFYRISAPEIVSGTSGESEQRLRELFTNASACAPALIFIDEIDAIASKREGGSSGGGSVRGMEKRIVAQLLTCMDSLTETFRESHKHVMVLGATNRADALDSALRRAGRFDREILVGVPDEDGREAILKVMTSQMRVSGDFNLRQIAKKTPGYVGADMRSLTKEAAVIAINRIFKDHLVCSDTNKDSTLETLTPIEEDSETAQNSTTTNEETKEKLNFGKADAPVPLTPEQMEPLYITMSDFEEATKHVQPSSKREGFATVPDVTWDDIGALKEIREELELSVLEPINHPERFKDLGLPLPAGVMLYGPPGCGKTLLAKAIASESGTNFISVKGPELLDKYVGESERAVRRVFERARASAPCVVFFDELDSLCPKRGSDAGGSGVSERVVNQLLTEMDGLDSRRSVFVIAATNRPELIDPAMMRPGRLDKLLYVPLPSPEDRASILIALSAGVNIDPKVDLSALAKSSRADGFSGADCAALLREAGLAVLRDQMTQRMNTTTEKNADSGATTRLQICEQHFVYAFDHVLPSVSKSDQHKYERMRDRMARARTRVEIPKNTESTSPNEEGAC